MGLDLSKQKKFNSCSFLRLGYEKKKPHLKLLAHLTIILFNFLMWAIVMNDREKRNESCTWLF